MILKCSLHFAGLLLLLLLPASCNCCKVLDDTFRVHSLPCTGFSGDQDRLILAVSQHELIGVVRDGEDVWRGLLALFASVGQHHLRVVHRQPLVGVDSDTEEARVGVDHPGCITLFEVVQHSGFMEVGHHGHVLNFIVLGRVHGEDLIFLHG